MASSLETHLFSIWRTWSCWDGPSPFTSFISLSLRDKVVARDGHLDPTTPANAPRNSTSGLRSWFCGSRSFSCSCMATPVRITTHETWRFMVPIVHVTYYVLLGYPLQGHSCLFSSEPSPGATSMGDDGWSSSTLSPPPSSS